MQLKHISADNLRADITAAVCDRAFIGDDDLPRSEKAFKEQIKRARSRLPAVKEGLARHLTEAAQEYIHLTNKMNRHPLARVLQSQLEHLIYAGFIAQTPWQQWPRLAIYLKAMQLRIEKYSANPARDQAREADVHELEHMWAERVEFLKRQHLPVSGSLMAFRWMIEELRISLFAQELKTPYPVSVKRLKKEWDTLIK